MVEPAYFIGPETPLLWRALRYGLVLKLEDLYTPYVSSIELIVHKIKNQPAEDPEIDELDFLQGDKENQPIEEVKHLDEEFEDLGDEHLISPVKEKVEDYENPPLRHMAETMQLGQIPDPVCISPVKQKSACSQSPSKAYNSLDRSVAQLVDPNNYHLKRSRKADLNHQNVMSVKSKAK